ncbi:MAG TPA: Holliday junction branch migration DNA helicase RuvB [Clostridiaceae bacterium]|nr:Holliday junction branch migration DNA helicase RuvB [Clostridiaceae bacterium]
MDDEQDEERIISRKHLTEDRDESGTRPKSLVEFAGQSRIKDNLHVYIEAALERGDALDHVLLYGPPGLGKTTLAGIIANELGVQMRITSGPAIERQGELAAILTNLEEHDVLFIDEIHRLNHTVEEILYPAMEDFALDIMIGKGPAARSIRLDLPPFTLIGATTRAGLLTSPLRDRFGMIHRLELYSDGEIVQILQRNASMLSIGINRDGLEILSGRCRGTPRVAIRLLRRMRDFAQVRGSGVIDREICSVGLKALEIDERGLDSTDRRIMLAMAEIYNGGPVGLDTLAATTGEDPGTIEDVYEPYLLQIGFIAKTPRGRMLTDQGFYHLGMEPVTRLAGNSALEAQLALRDLEQEQSEQGESEQESIEQN